jgi:hypothetical protein
MAGYQGARRILKTVDIAGSLARYLVLDENDRMEKLGGRPARFSPVLLGITKAARATESVVPRRTIGPVARAAPRRSAIAGAGPWRVASRCAVRSESDRT